jgi:hypothetical protein
MNREQYLAAFKEITDRMYETTKAKNHDYTGNSDDPFVNFRFVEMMGVCSTEQGFFTRMTDKMSRIAGFIKTGVLKVSDEKIEDTLIDLAVYCLLFVCYLRSKRVDNSK